MKIWGLDIASHTGVAEGVVGERPRLYTMHFVKEHDTHDDACGRAIAWVAERTSIERPDLVYMEAPIPNAAMAGRTNADTMALLFGLAASIGGTLRARGIPVRRVNIQKIRKHFIGVGNLKGPEAKRRTVALCKALGWEPPNHDAADAAAVWHYGVCQHNPRLAPHLGPLLLTLNGGAAS